MQLNFVLSITLSLSTEWAARALEGNHATSACVCALPHSPGLLGESRLLTRGAVPEASKVIVTVFLESLLVPPRLSSYFFVPDPGECAVPWNYTHGVTGWLPTSAWLWNDKCTLQHQAWKYDITSALKVVTLGSCTFIWWCSETALKLQHLSHILSNGICHYKASSYTGGWFLQVAGVI